MELSTAASAASTSALQGASIGTRVSALSGTYAGIAKGEGGQPDHHLILLDVKPSGALNWKDAVAWGSKVGDGLPTRNESALLYAHLRDEFEGGWHWTGTQYSSYDAWIQYFSGGYQYDDTKEFEARARAVRRLPLQSFSPSIPAQISGDVLQAILDEIKGARADVREIFLADTGAAA